MTANPELRAEGQTPPPPRVADDPELSEGRAAFVAQVEGIPLRAESIAQNRAHFAALIPEAAELVRDRPVKATELRIPGPPNVADIEITVLSPAHRLPGELRPGVLGIHGGGYVLGNRHFCVPELIDLVEQWGIIGVAVEYRLAPEHRAPAAAEDCYAALQWMHREGAEVGIAPDRLAVTGASAGGGLAAAVALLARDRGGPSLLGQFLDCPMLDDRDRTVSTRQFDGIGPWDRQNNLTGWAAALGADVSTAAVDAYQAPARAQDLSGLPPAYLDVGSAEVFRDETIAYARAIWQAGGSAELHVWSGGFHGFSGVVPQARVSLAASAARASWWRRILTA